MTSAIQQLQHDISERDTKDALRIVEVAITLAAIPGMLSPAARDLATIRLRELIHLHPRAGEVLAAVVAHLESY